jgi:hypothetical protein
MNSHFSPQSAEALASFFDSQGDDALLPVLNPTPMSFEDVVSEANAGYVRMQAQLEELKGGLRTAEAHAALTIEAAKARLAQVKAETAKVEAEAAETLEAAKAHLDQIKAETAKVEAEAAETLEAAKAHHQNRLDQIKAETAKVEAGAAETLEAAKAHHQNRTEQIKSTNAERFGIQKHCVDTEAAEALEAAEADHKARMEAAKSAHAAHLAELKKGWDVEEGKLSAALQAGLHKAEAEAQATRAATRANYESRIAEIRGAERVPEAEAHPAPKPRTGKNISAMAPAGHMGGLGRGKNIGNAAGDTSEEEEKDERHPKKAIKKLEEELAELRGVVASLAAGRKPPAKKRGKSSFPARGALPESALPVIEEKLAGLGDHVVAKCKTAIAGIRKYVDYILSYIFGGRPPKIPTKDLGSWADLYAWILKKIAEKERKAAAATTSPEVASALYRDVHLLRSITVEAYKEAAGEMYGTPQLEQYANLVAAKERVGAPKRKRASSLTPAIVRESGDEDDTQMQPRKKKVTFESRSDAEEEEEEYGSRVLEDGEAYYDSADEGEGEGE